MFDTVREFVDLVESGDEASQLRIRLDHASTAIWKEVLRQRPDLKRVVTLNKTLDDDILRLLAKDGDYFVRMDVANRRGLPHDLFELLAQDANESVRARIACNKKTPLEILRFMIEDHSALVAKAAKKRLKM